MPSRFSSGKNAIAQCDICGFRFKLSQLKSLTIKTKRVNILACSECWNPDHPQLKIGMYPINDPQAVRDPRSDVASYPQSRSYTEVIYNGVGVSIAVGTLITNGVEPNVTIFNAGSGAYNLTGAAATLIQTTTPITATSFFSGGMFQGGFYAGGHFSVTSGGTPPTPTSNKFFSGGMFRGGMYAGGFFSN
jgi:hypothetical protein